MKTVKLLSLLACLLLMFCLVACQNGGEGDQPTEAPTTQNPDDPSANVSADPDAIASYTVYLSEDATVWERKCAESLIDMIEAKTGTTLTLNRDPAARTECEIILTGKVADAGFDAAKIGYNGYAVKRDGSKLTLAATIENGMLEALTYACEQIGADGKVAASIDLDRLLLETDCPYMTPVPFRGRRNNSALIIHTAEKIAELRSITAQEVIDTARENAYRLFNIK